MDKGGDAPPQPDFNAMAQAQGQANIEAARTYGRMANPNIRGPLGNRDVTWNGDTPTINDTLTPSGQRQFDTMMRTNEALGNLGERGLTRVGEATANPFDMSKVRAAPTVPIADEAGRRAVTAAILARQEPGMKRQRAAAENDLLIQGHNRGGEAWNAKQNDLNMAETDARLAADIAGGAEQSRLFGLGERGYAMGTQGRQQDIQEQTFLRNQPLAELNALRSGTSPTLPQFQQFTAQQVGAAPVMQAGQLGAQYDLGRAGAQQSGNNALMSGLFSLGGAAMGAPAGGWVSKLFS